MERPGLLKWIWYAMGGGLGPRYREWVLHDVTTRHWRWRAAFRSLVQILPVGVLLLILLPGAPWVRVMALVGGVLMGMVYALAYLDESSEHRAIKAGYARGTAQQVRDAANSGKRAEAELRYAERYRGEVSATPRSSG